MNHVSSLMPPRIALIALIAMLVLHITVPLATAVHTPFSCAKAALMAAGVAMVVFSRRAFQAAATPITPFSESTALIRHGLYCWTRNPMYFGAVLLVLAWLFCAAA
ncbi:MAG TPA: methyltransferase [Gemmatimonadales bacterium]|nr:methyltransferase [Gemmatimonadales bacterium]